MHVHENNFSLSLGPFFLFLGFKPLPVSLVLLSQEFFTHLLSWGLLSSKLLRSFSPSSIFLKEVDNNEGEKKKCLLNMPLSLFLLMFLFLILLCLLRIRDNNLSHWSCPCIYNLCLSCEYTVCPHKSIIRDEMKREEETWEREESGVSTEKQEIQITCESREKGREEIQEGYTPLVLIVLFSPDSCFTAQETRDRSWVRVFFLVILFLRRQVYSFSRNSLSLSLPCLTQWLRNHNNCLQSHGSLTFSTDRHESLSKFSLRLESNLGCSLTWLFFFFSSDFFSFSLSFWLHHLRFVSSNFCDFFFRQTWQFPSLFTAKTSPDKVYTEVPNKKERIAFFSLVQIALQTESSSSSTFRSTCYASVQAVMVFSHMHALSFTLKKRGRGRKKMREEREKHLQELELRLKMCSLSSTSLFSHSFSLCFCDAVEKRAVLFREDCNARNFYLDFILFPLTLLLSSWVRLMYEPFGKKVWLNIREQERTAWHFLCLQGLKTASHLPTHFSLIFFPDSEGVSPQSFLQWIKLSWKFLPLCLSTACPLFLRPTQIPSITMNKTRGEGGRVSLSHLLLTDF